MQFQIKRIQKKYQNCFYFSTIWQRRISCCKLQQWRLLLLLLLLSIVIHSTESDTS